MSKAGDGKLGLVAVVAIGVGGMVYFGSDDGCLYALK